MVPDFSPSLASLAHAFDTLHVEWAIGGSFASTMHGEPRSTNDLDVIAALATSHARDFVALLGDDFYADESMILEAVRRCDSFNVIDQRTLLKIDVFVPAQGPLGRGQLARRQAHVLGEHGPRIFVLGPEDTVLQKLRWFQLTGETSDRQWRDLTTILRIRSDLDVAYLHEVAHDSGLEALLDRALATVVP